MTGHNAARRHQLVAAIAAGALLSALAAAQGGGSLGLEQPALLGEPLGSPLAGDELVRETDEVTRLMRCPVCQGLSVADSPTDSALAMKREAADLLAAGYTGDQVLAYFERSYGEFIRLAPKAEGFNIVVWITPIAGLLLGLALIAARLRRVRRPRPEAGSDDDEAFRAYRERVHREIDQ